MPKEIERKFLVKDTSWKLASLPVRMVQGYLSTDPDRTVRVRRAGESAFLTIKGRTVGIGRTEVEFAISIDQAEELFPLCLPHLIEKTRHLLTDGDFTWEIDEFHAENAGLVVAEIELPSEDADFPRPAWLGEEVSADFRYTNSHLSQTPFSNWD